MQNSGAKSARPQKRIPISELASNKINTDSDADADPERARSSLRPGNNHKQDAYATDCLPALRLRLLLNARLNRISGLNAFFLFSLFHEEPSFLIFSVNNRVGKLQGPFKFQ